MTEAEAALANIDAQDDEATRLPISFDPRDGWTS
jgi:hypothetical protein